MSKRAKRPQQKGRGSKVVKDSLGAQELTSRVRDIIKHLRIIHSAVVVSVGALKHQNCELDEDVASVLQRSVADRLLDQIEQLASLGGLSPDDESLEPEGE